MTQYILLIEDNVRRPVLDQDWAAFFELAGQSGVFRGGSAMGKREVLGDRARAQSTDFLGGYMIFEAEDKQEILDLLEKHPVKLHGGSLHLCELPKT